MSRSFADSIGIEVHMGSAHRFEGELVLGHKGAAVEVPFDPAERWGIAAQPLWHGRRGHVVDGRLNGKPFTSSVVPRMKRFWVLVDEKLMNAANVAVGDIVEVAIEPSQSAVKLEAPKRTLPTARMVRERVNRAKRKR